ncbi:Scr1 family TA system antitoxin-like transcriptional regulator [Streptomyces sp. NPDC091377]|uniref:helix-turn-helix domain-containing protein n=1 Tax=Streptomyces sp. NPDC091377 TaxID=3365995 RepID=UPI00382A868D
METDAPERSDDTDSVVAVVGRLVRLARQRAGTSVVDFAKTMGYGEDMIRKIERGDRIPRPEFLDRADDLLQANGYLRAFREDMRKARYPKKDRQLKELEDRATELTQYSNHNLQGLLQTPEHMRALFEMRLPVYSADMVESGIQARMARKAVFERDPAPALTFIQEQVTLERPVGGRKVLRAQLEHLLEVGRLRNVTLQVMPTERGEHAGMHGLIEVLKFADGTTLGRRGWSHNGDSPFVSDPAELRILELRLGAIRSQALPPQESLAFIESRLGTL